MLRCNGQMTNSVPNLRAERGWTQGDLAKQLRVSRQTVNAIETGCHDPSLPLAFAIAKLFRRRIEEIFQPRSMQRTSCRWARTLK
jgi:putative transcriptional regulator